MPERTEKAKPKPLERGMPDFSSLTEQTMLKRNSGGNTPLHTALRTGRFAEIPPSLLKPELFVIKNKKGQTPLYWAAVTGQLNQLPKEVLTKENLCAPAPTWRVGESTTILHLACEGHANQIPKEFLKPEFLSIKDGSGATVLHQLIPREGSEIAGVGELYPDDPMWEEKDAQGKTAREALECVLGFRIHRAAYIGRSRMEPATEKQKHKLRFFGCTFDQEILKGQASDALDECVRMFPEIEEAYYKRPATEEQLAKLREIHEEKEEEEDRDNEPEEEYVPKAGLSYGEAKAQIENWELDQQVYEHERLMEERDKEKAQAESEEGRIEEECNTINCLGLHDYTRDITTEELGQAWALVKSREPEIKDFTAGYRLREALEELHPDIVKPMRPGVIGYKYCVHCRGQIEELAPRNPVIGISKKTKDLIERKSEEPSAYFEQLAALMEQDCIQKQVECPHCKRKTEITLPNYFSFKCPNCEKEWSVFPSDEGEKMKCPNCDKEVEPRKTEQKVGKLERDRMNESHEGVVGEGQQSSCNPPTEAQLKKIREWEFELDTRVEITAENLEGLLRLDGKPASDEDVKWFARYGFTYFRGDAVAAFAFRAVIRQMEDIAKGQSKRSWEARRIAMSCLIAKSDPAFQKPRITLDRCKRLTLAWPEQKLNEWYRKGAKI